LETTPKELKNNNLVKREAFNEIPPRVDYTSTKDGEKLRQAILPILQWQFQRKERLPHIVHVQ